MPSSRFRVVTDSTADLPESWRERYQIGVVPLTVSFGNESFKDRVDITDEQFFKRLAGAKELPKTAAPSPGDFAAMYESLRGDCDGIISIHLGGNISATVESARIGAQTVEGLPIEVIDSGTVTMPIAFLCKVAAESSTVEEAKARVEERIDRTRVLALLDTLRYVEMGGRVSRAQAMIGGMLDLKPLLGVSGGEIKSLDRVRTRSRAIPRMIELARADYPLEYLGVVHAQAPEEADRIRQELQPELPDVEIVTGTIGTVLATHTGPRALGLVYLKR